jgi:hypothetical protein
MTKKVDVFLNYTINSLETGELIDSYHETLAVETSLSLSRKFRLPEDIELGKYEIKAIAYYDDKFASSGDSFDVVKEPLIITILWTIFTNDFTWIAILLIVIGYFAFRFYKKKKKEKRRKARYVFPVDFKKLPKGIKIGKIAETDVNAYIDPDKLTQHMIIAGGTGSGKTVAAMVMAEELLKKNIPVIVFDPTAQWTGFIRSSRDDRMLKSYSKFGLRPEDARAFKGSIIDVIDPDMSIDIESCIKKGEITIFCMNKLTPSKLDKFVRQTIDTIFSVPWKEARGLELLIVYDEVHRLLPKYGGKGGYVALERGVREFRKWGIGLIMISQVLMDFRGAIRAVIATEAQLRTKYKGDMNRVQSKFGSRYASTLPKLKTGTGMIQNPEFNDGKPWFIETRPLLHDTSRISEEELKKYTEYGKIISDLEAEIEKLKKKKVETYDIKLELGLAKEKVKLGQLRMAETYIESVKTRIKSLEK